MSFTYLLAGFPSPWRFLRRLYWGRKFKKMPRGARKVATHLKIDPKSLKQKGLL